MSVNSLETEPTRYTVSAEAATPRSGSCVPNPAAHTTSSPSTSAMENASSPFCARSRSIIAVSASATPA